MPGIGTIHGFCARSHAERDLRRRRVFAPSDLFERVDERLVGRQRLGCEARQGRSEVALLEGGAGVHLAGQETAAERAERDEADAEFLERGRTCPSGLRVHSEYSLWTAVTG